jgi:hypothetical protein
VKHMKISAALAVSGLLLLLVQQTLWPPGDNVPMPWLFAPLVLGLILLVASIAIGVARGTWLYRAALVLGLLGLVAIGASVALPLDRGVAGPRPTPTNAQIVLIAGVVLAVLSSIAGGVAIVRSSGTNIRSSSR